MGLKNVLVAKKKSLWHSFFHLLAVYANLAMLKSKESIAAIVQEWARMALDLDQLSFHKKNVWREV